MRFPQSSVVSPSSYRWVILAFIFAGNFATGLLFLAVPPMELAIAREFGLGASRVALLVNAPTMVFILLSMPLALRMTNYAATRVCGVGAALLALAGMMRAFAGGYPQLLVWTLLFGLGVLLFFNNLPRIIRQWFRPEEVGTATGISISGFSMGASVSFALVPPLFGDDWRRCFFLLAWVAVATTVGWWLGAREFPERERPLGKTARGGGVGLLLKKPTLPILSLLLALYQGGRTTWVTFGFPYLVVIKEISKEVSGYVFMANLLGFIVGNSMVPLWSDRIGLRRPFLIGSSGVAAVLILLFLRSTSLPLTIFLSVGIGISLGCNMPLIYAVCIESPEVGRTELATAIGLIQTFGNTGALFIPLSLSFLIGDLEGATAGRYSQMWVVLVLILAAVGGTSLALRETGPRAKDRTARPPGSAAGS